VARRRAQEPATEPPFAPAPADESNGYSSFVVKWRRRLGAERIEVEHIQSGDSTRVSSVGDAVDWMRRQVR